MRSVLEMKVTRGRRPVALAAILLAACSGGVEPHELASGDEAAKLFWALTVDHEAVTLSTEAPYNTLQLTATPRDANGDPIEGLGPVRFRSLNTTVVVVSETGLVRGVGAGQGTEVVASLTVGPVDHQASTIVNVTTQPAPPTLAEFSIAPVPPDSARRGAGGDLLFGFFPDGRLKSNPLIVIPIHAQDADGQPLFDVLASFRSLDASVVSVFAPGSFLVFAPRSPGRTRVAASATYYGVRLVDTAEFAVTMPILGAVKIRPRVLEPGGPPRAVFEPETITVAPGGTVFWTNVTGQPAEVVFDDPGAALEHGVAHTCAAGGGTDTGGAGNIAAFGVPIDPALEELDSRNCRSRRFVTPGVYPFRNPATGATGRVVVDDGLGGA